MHNSQSPVGSGFGFKTRATEIVKGIDLSGKLAIVTGWASGIGLETTRALASAGAKVIVPARDIRDSRGYESQFATNHLGHFQLTVRLCRL